MEIVIKEAEERRNKEGQGRGEEESMKRISLRK
jgi:hypothetical protein